MFTNRDSMDIIKTIKELTREEKIALVSGCDFMYTNPVPRLDIPSVRMSDGPHGLRVQTEGGDNGVTGSEPATCFPTAATTASSWNPDNVHKMGQAIGEEAGYYGVDVVLGPAVNIKRNPLGGRCFEYFSEDPYLAGKMGTAETLGIQEKGVGVSVKHFALNNSENYRFMGDSIADMRAIREIYLKPFEMIVKSAKPETMMCAYNKINGVYCAENQWLLTDVLRKEWGFDGLVMTDWGATHDRLKMLCAGLDLEMPGDTTICRKWIMDGLEDGTLNEDVLDEAVRNVLILAEKHETKIKSDVDFTAHHTLAKDIAVDSAVLLKNDGMLPLQKGKKYFICGELFEKMRYQGSGSSMINPTYLSTPKTAFDEQGVQYVYTKGYKENEIQKNEGLINEALNLCGDYDDILVFAGLTDYVESEGADRENMRLPENQLSLIGALIETGKNITVILYGGSPMELPFADKVNAILNMYLPGQNGGNATYDLLFGEVSPSGKLAETWVKEYADIPFGDTFGKTQNEVYKESIFVGYRYYLSAGKAVRYPFGYGLSYTSFAYENMTIAEKDGGYQIACDITNTGNFDGAEVVQLYVGTPAVEVFRPIRELKGFAKVYLKAGETKHVEIAVDKCDLQYWNITENRYVLEGGEYRFELCSDCETVKLSAKVNIDGEQSKKAYTDEIFDIYRGVDFDKVTDSIFEEMSGVKIPPLPPKKPIRLESRFSDMKATFMGKILYTAVLSVAKGQMRKAKKLPEGAERDNKIKGAIFLERILDSNSIITMSMSAGASCPYNMAEMFVHLANGKIFKGLKCLCCGIKAPPLPKDKENKNGK